MRRLFRLLRLLAVAQLGVVLSACGSATFTPLPVQPAAVAERAAKHPLHLKHAGSIVYVGSVGGFIDVFTLVKGQYQRTQRISDYNGPEGIHTDSAGNMYVADQGLSSYGEPSGDIAIYPKGKTYPEREIAPGYNVSDVFPVGVESYMYASNFGTVGSGFGPGSLSYYAPTGNEPLWTKRISGAFQAWSLVRDPSSKDVFVSYSTGYLSSGPSYIARFVHGKQKKVHVIAQIPQADGLAEDGSGHLLAAGAGNITILSQQGMTLGSITVPGSAYRMAFNRDYSLLYVTNFYNHDVEIFSYPAGTEVATITSGDWSKYNWTDGIAVYPPPQ